jgi:hypothetical protein
MSGQPVLFDLFVETPPVYRRQFEASRYGDNRARASQTVVGIARPPLRLLGIWLLAARCAASGNGLGDVACAQGSQSPPRPPMNGISCLEGVISECFGSRIAGFPVARPRASSRGAFLFGLLVHSARSVRMIELLIPAALDRQGPAGQTNQRPASLLSAAKPARGSWACNSADLAGCARMVARTPRTSHAAYVRFPAGILKTLLNR